MKRGFLFGLGSLLVLLVPLASQAEAQAPLDAVLKACEKKTIVMGRDDKGNLVKAGENIDGFCRGFLEGALALLVRARTICVKDKNTSPDFLLSTVLTYRIETKSPDNDAATVIEAAFKRAFTCEK
jgi:hypothetical protein